MVYGLYGLCGPVCMVYGLYGLCGPVFMVYGLYGLCGHKATLNGWSELKSCVKVEVAPRP